jgi:hypothetical protein
MCFIQNPENRLRLNLLCTYAVILCASFISQASFAQTGTVGTGTLSNSSLPFRSSGTYSYSQQIYTASELSAAGVFGPGLIQSIAFYCNTAGLVTTNFNAIDVYMGNTSQSTFTSLTGWIPSTSLTNVGTWNLPATTSLGWMIFTLETPFFWDGVSNLVLAMDENQPNVGATVTVDWRYYTVTSVPGTEKLFLSTVSSINPDPNAPPAATTSSNALRSQIQLSISSNCGNISNLPVYNNVVAGAGICNSQTLLTNPNFNSYQWKRDNINILGAQSSSYLIPADPDPGLHSYICEAYCEANGQTIVSNIIDVQTKNCIADYSSPINYMLVRNVTTTGINTSNQTAQVQFDLNWGYSWKDSINWDAAWVFMKYKNAAGEWKPCKIKTTGYDHGQGTPINVNVPADQMGAFVSMSQYGNAHVDIQGMQLQWDYGTDGISNPGLLEVKVFAIEMVFIPSGEFNMFRTFGPEEINAPGNNFVVINDRISPVLTFQGGSCRVKGDSGLDSDADGSVDNPEYPTGYTPFYAFKYEMTEQQYADFLNCLTASQQSTLGIAGSSITLNNGLYFASAPNRACNGYTDLSALAYADWAGLRPISILEFCKAALGPYVATANSNSPLSGTFSNVWGSANDVGSGDFSGSSKNASGSGYYGMKDLGGNTGETLVSIGFNSFSKNIHGDGILNVEGSANVSNWSGFVLKSCEPYTTVSPHPLAWHAGDGFRFARTAE